MTGVSNFFYIYQNKAHDSKLAEIHFTDNILIVIAFALSAAIAIIGSLFLVFVIYLATK